MKKVFLVILILIVNFKFSNAQKTPTQVVDTFPANFGKGKAYLYVITEPGYFQVNHALKKIFEKEYKGAYELVDLRALSTQTKKDNVTLYLFEMIYDNQAGYFSAGERVGPETNYSCGVKDSDGNLFRLSGFGGNYNKVITNYVKRLEAIRTANESTH